MHWAPPSHYTAAETAPHRSRQGVEEETEGRLKTASESQEVTKAVVKGHRPSSDLSGHQSFTGSVTYLLPACHGPLPFPDLDSVEFWLSGYLVSVAVSLTGLFCRWWSHWCCFYSFSHLLGKAAKQRVSWLERGVSCCCLQLIYVSPQVLGDPATQPVVGFRCRAAAQLFWTSPVSLWTLHLTQQEVRSEAALCRMFADLWRHVTAWRVGSAFVYKCRDV